MKQLTESRAGEILLVPFPRELQHAIVILYGFDGSPIDTIRIATDPEGGNWALENGDDVLRVFDTDGSGSINAHELKRALCGNHQLIGLRMRAVGAGQTVRVGARLSECGLVGGRV